VNPASSGEHRRQRRKRVDAEKEIGQGVDFLPLQTRKKQDDKKNEEKGLNNLANTPGVRPGKFHEIFVIGHFALFQCLLNQMLSLGSFGFTEGGSKIVAVDLRRE